MKNYFEILKVSETDSKKTIEDSYHILISKYKGTDDILMMRDIEEAWMVLGDDEKRIKYIDYLQSIRKPDVNTGASGQSTSGFSKQRTASVNLSKKEDITAPRWERIDNEETGRSDHGENRVNTPNYNGNTGPGVLATALVACAIFGAGGYVVLQDYEFHSDASKHGIVYDYDQYDTYYDNEDRYSYSDDLQAGYESDYEEEWQDSGSDEYGYGSELLADIYYDAVYSFGESLLEDQSSTNSNYWCIFDMDDDGIPELLLNQGEYTYDEVMRCVTYDMDNDEWVEFNEFGVGVPYAAPDGDGIYLIEGRMGYMNITGYRKAGNGMNYREVYDGDGEWDNIPVPVGIELPRYSYDEAVAVYDYF